LSDWSSSLSSLSEEDVIDFLTKNQVKLSICPLSKVKVDEIGDRKKNYIRPDQMEIINNPTSLFRVGVLPDGTKLYIEKEKDITAEKLEEKLKFLDGVLSKKSSTDVSQYSELS
jgi:hypothetical protein